MSTKPDPTNNTASLPVPANSDYVCEGDENCARTAEFLAKIHGQAATYSDGWVRLCRRCEQAANANGILEEARPIKSAPVPTQTEEVEPLICANCGHAQQHHKDGDGKCYVGSCNPRWEGRCYVFIKPMFVTRSTVPPQTQTDEPPARVWMAKHLISNTELAKSFRVPPELQSQCIEYAHLEPIQRALEACGPCMSRYEGEGYLAVRKSDWEALRDAINKD